ncbi:helix-turn-helix domain-containing protein [Gracilibacillus timonensis]|uniref:helix-turn-helix domain-containing protein n=1 Tax=Gracilibacillus timonensis TaxID=1816696 RepID=UPI000825D5B7|nr:helix-turn-helix transcriptional regulator [Gracilibacillus timonensis]
METLAKRLKQARKLTRLSQKQAGDTVGLANGTISGYERNYRDPDTQTLFELADLYEISIDWLLGRDSFQQENADLTTEMNKRLKQYGMTQSSLLDIERWKRMGEKEWKELEHYFKYITDTAQYGDD